jgi:DNA-binding transcriptional LysR family regulator
MRLNQVRHFTSVVEAGSIRAAARSLGASHPAITKSVRQLEDELRVQLIQRTSRGVILTKAGRAFLARARVIQAEVRKAEEELANIAGERGGSVAVGIAPAAALMLGPEAFASFLLRHPSARLRIVDGAAGALVPLVRDETLDMAIGQKPTSELPAAVRFRVLFRTPVVVAGRRGHPLRASKSLGQLAAQCWMVVNPPGSGGLLERALTAAGLPFPQRFVHCESYPVGQELIARTDALMLLPPRLIAESTNRWPLIEIPVNDPLPPLVIGMYTRAESRPTAFASAMARSISDVARKLAQAG